MTDHQEAGSRALPPHAQLIQMGTASWVSAVVYAAAKLDMVMIVFPGGQERTEAEYASLLGKAGFRLSRVVPTASAVSVVEAVLS